MSERCYRCFRPVKFCLCNDAKPVDAGVKFVLLMHPKEARHERNGTGRLAHLCLVDSELFIGIDFTNHKQLHELLSNEHYFPVLLYPTDGAETIFDLQKNNCDAFRKKKLLVIVIDGTWFCAKKIIQKNPFLLSLPHLSFAHSYSSEFIFKRGPKPNYISTIESCFYVIREMQEARLASEHIDASPLMNVFRKMVRVQLQAQNDRIDGKLPNTHNYNWKYTKKISLPK